MKKPKKTLNEMRKQEEEFYKQEKKDKGKYIVGTIDLKGEVK